MRFSIRFLLVVVALLAMCGGLYHHQLARHSKFRKCESALANMELDVSLDWAFPAYVTRLGMEDLLWFLRAPVAVRIGQPTYFESEAASRLPPADVDIAGYYNGGPLDESCIEASDQDVKVAQRQLRSIGALQECILTNVLFTPKQLECVLSSTHYRRLTVEGMFIHGRLFGSARVCDGIRDIELYRCNVDGIATNAIAECGNLQSLTMSECSLSNNGTRWLGDLRNLRSLVLHRVRLDDATLECITSLRALETLNLSATNITDEDVVTVVRELSSLRALYCNWTDVGDEMCGAIGDKAGAGSHLMLALGVAGTRVTASGIERLVELGCLQQLDIGGMQINDAMCEELSKLSGLQVLRLDSTNVSGRQVYRILGRSTALREVYVTNCSRISPSDLVLLRRQYPRVTFYY